MLNNLKFRLFLLGFFTLYLELMLIRYLPSKIWNLGYFPNLILLAVFIGMGLGFVAHNRLSAEKSQRVFGSLPAVLLGLVVFVIALHPDVPGFSRWQGKFGGELYFTASHAGSQIFNAAMIPIWFFSIIALFAIVSQYTAKVFAQLDPLTAYSCDILGSCAGILTFFAVSLFRIPAWTWFAALIPLFLAVTFPAPSGRRRRAAALFAVAALLVFLQDSKIIQVIKGWTPIAQFVWSPYQHIKFKDPVLYVNGLGHQEIIPPEGLKTAFYNVPYLDREKHPDLPPYRKVLIIGAGTGNDVSTALMQGATSIDAVEIDPSIAELGKTHNPNHPYQDPKVRLTIDDGRAFLTRADSKYDLIILALTDSLVKISPMSQLRLENYLFTVDTVRRAFSLLNENGSLVMYNFYRTKWLIDKLRTMMYVGSDHHSAEVLLDEKDFAILKVTHSPATLAAAPPVNESGESFDLPVDDWPFLYLRQREIPATYMAAIVGMIALIMAAMFLLERSQSSTGAPGAAFNKAGFALMGTAFLLLETKSVIQFSLLFGTTWLNNSLVFLAVLASVLAANWVAYLVRFKGFLYVAFGLLIAACVLSYQYPIAHLLYYDDRLVRFVLASLLTFSPIFFANLIFSLVFRGQKSAEHLFGWNLIGSTLGGVVEYSSMAIGYHALTLIVTGCYIAAFGLFLAAKQRAAAPLPLSTNQTVV